MLTDLYLFAGAVLLGAAVICITVRLLDRWLVKVFDPNALPKPIKVRKAAHYVPETAVIRCREDPNRKEDTKHEQ